MAKIDSSQILKEGADLKAKEIDYGSEKVQSQIQQTERRQKQIRRLKRLIRTH